MDKYRIRTNDNIYQVLDTSSLPQDKSFWAQLIKLVVGLGIVIAVQSLTKSPLLALLGGHNAGNAVRYFLMVLVGGALWPMTFKFFGKLGRKKAVAA